MNRSPNTTAAPVSAPTSGNAHVDAVRAEFVVTKEYRLFAEFCDTCSRYRYVGLCYGAPGVGKTLSARYYAHWDLLSSLLPRYAYASTSKLPPEIAARGSVLYTAPVANTPNLIANEVERLRLAISYLIEAKGNVQREVNMLSDEANNRRPKMSDVANVVSVASAANVRDSTKLIIVDEADRLRHGSLEQVRDIFDRADLGLILIGMPGLEKRLSRYPQLYSRVGFVHQFRSLGPQEAQDIIEQPQKLGVALGPDHVTDAEAVAAIIRITGGNFRLMQRLFTQIERIMRINQLCLVTKEVVMAARESLVIGLA